MRMFVLFLALLTTSSYGAEVKKLLKKSKKVVISEGKNTGFSKDQEVCVYDENNTEVVCATIYKAKKKKSYIKIKKKKIFKTIKKGMTISLKNPEAAAAAMAGSTKPKAAMNVKLGYVFTPITPSKFNVPSYSDPKGQTVNTLWTSDRVASLSLFGFGAEVGFGIGGSKAVVGFKSRSYKGYTVKSDYTDDPTHYAESTISASGFGGHFDFNYLIFEFGNILVDFGNGLDFDLTSMQYIVDHKNDNDSDVINIYEVTSDSTTISLRTNLNVGYYFDPVGIQVSTTLLIPLSSSVSDSISYDDATNEALLSGIEAAADIRQALGHTNSDIGLEMMFSAYWAF